MLSSIWWLTMAFMFIFLVPALGYGWGYRGWGPPLPTFVQRRRHATAQKQLARDEKAAEKSVARNINHLSWRWGGDLVWLIVLFGMIFALASYAWWV